LLFGRPVPAVDHDYMGVATAVTPFDARYRRLEMYLQSGESFDHRTISEPRRSGVSDRLSVLRQCLKMAMKFKYIRDGTAGGQLNPDQRSRPAEQAAPSDSWQLPEETEQRGAGDCEDQAIWLYARLIQMGFKDVRLILGKYRADQATYHAWVAYYLANKIYILDPTNNHGLWEIRQYPEGFYKPIYSYSQSSRWSHMGGYVRLLGQTLGAREIPDDPLHPIPCKASNVSRSADWDP
jgi:hypothetical protein